MTGATLTPARTGVIAAAVDSFTAEPPSASSYNSQRISWVLERLNMLLYSGSRNNTTDLFNLYLTLASLHELLRKVKPGECHVPALIPSPVPPWYICHPIALLTTIRGLDFCVANNEVPLEAHELPNLLKKVCQHKNDLVLQAAIMVLMISVKDGNLLKHMNLVPPFMGNVIIEWLKIACKFGWFSAKDAEELLTLAKEIKSGFCSPGPINSERNYFLPTVFNIMTRFCPRMKMGQILASLDVNPGFGAYLVDFHISRKGEVSSKENIWLFVAQKDSIETSACLISPPQVNFLINGFPVKKRTNVQMVTGPQIPTNLFTMLKYGTNLLQAVGQFNSHYMIIISYMSVASTTETPALQDYVHPAITAEDSDSEIIVGPSRISLNCPISYSRIKTPVKGHSCKHLQCFDLNNFVEINTRTPYWRCPHCNQCVSYLDIRLDQHLVKVLREVGENVADVIIFADGSWKPVSESNDHLDQPCDKAVSCQQDGSELQELTSSSDALPIVLDLTEGDDERDLMDICEAEDRKPFQANSQSHSIATTLTMQPDGTNICQTNQDSTSVIEDDFWSGILLSSYPGSDAQNIGGIAEPSLANNMIFPVAADAVSPAHIQGPDALRGNTSSVLHCPLSASNNLQLQQSQVSHIVTSNEYGRFPSIPRHLSRIPIAIQALPAQSQQNLTQQRLRTSLNSSTSNGSSMAPTADGFNTIGSDLGRQHAVSRSHRNPMHISEMASPLMQQHSLPQNWEWDHQDRLFTPVQSVQHVSGLPAPSQLPSVYRQPSGVRTEHLNLHSQQALSRRIHPTSSQSSNLVSRPPSHIQRTQIQQVGTQAGVGHTAGPGYLYSAASQRATQMIRQSQQSPVQIQASRTGASLSVNGNGLRATSAGDHRGNIGGTVQSVSRAESLVDLSSEQNWRPTGRMRGSLSGHAYSAALSQFMIQPTQPIQSPIPPVNQLPIPPVPSPLHVLIANNRNAHAPQAHNNSPMNELAGTSGESGVLLERSSDLH